MSTARSAPLIHPGWRDWPAAQVALGATLLLAAGIGLATLVLLRGGFVYTLDDPYIHLALAERIARGHYGINAGEVTAPSSSALWPFLLVPGVGTEWHPYLPLLLNLAAAAGTAWVIGRLVDALPWGPGAGAARLAAALLLVVAGNVAGLPFTGMEHSAQGLVAAIAALGVVQALRGGRVAWWVIAATALGPALRYEMLAPVGALMLALAGQRRWGAAAALLAGSLAIPVAFGAFLVAQGLPPLPKSVLAKGDVYGDVAGPLARLGAALTELVTRPRRWPFLALLALLGVLAARAQGPARWPLLGAVGALLLQALVGRFGWFFRYEAYALLFGGLVLAGAVAGAGRWWRGAALGVLAAAVAQAPAIPLSPVASLNVREQQYQMHRFLTEEWRRDVAVNDLGWPSYRIDPGIHVLDLYGLASNEALRQRVKDAAWLEGMVARRGIGLAMIFPWWFQGIPGAWVPVGRLWLSGPQVAVAGDHVTFFATSASEVAGLRAALARFAPRLPVGVRLDILP